MLLLHAIGCRLQSSESCSANYFLGAYSLYPQERIYGRLCTHASVITHLSYLGAAVFPDLCEVRCNAGFWSKCIRIQTEFQFVGHGGAKLKTRHGADLCPPPKAQTMAMDIRTGPWGIRRCFTGLMNNILFYIMSWNAWHQNTLWEENKPVQRKALGIVWGLQQHFEMLVS